MSEIAFYYIGGDTPYHLPGVPKRHLTQAEFEQKKPHVQLSIKASPLYAAAADVDPEALQDFEVDEGAAEEE